MALTEWVTTTLLVAAGVFYFAGTVGLLRFPDVYTRLHALTKADNLGLGFLVIGLSLQAGSWAGVAKLLLIWCLVLIASAVGSHMVARSAFRTGVRPLSANELRRVRQ